MNILLLIFILMQVSGLYIYHLYPFQDNEDRYHNEVGWKKHVTGNYIIFVFKPSVPLLHSISYNHVGYGLTLFRLDWSIYADANIVIFNWEVKFK